MAKYHSLPEVWGTVDGLTLKIQSTKDDKVQSIFYNGWTHGHYVSSVFVFGMDGVIKICGLNAPGTMHDSTLADYGSVYEKLEAVFDETRGRWWIQRFVSRTIILLLNQDRTSHLAIYRWPSELVTPQRCSQHVDGVAAVDAQQWQVDLPVGCWRSSLENILSLESGRQPRILGRIKKVSHISFFLICQPSFVKRANPCEHLSCIHNFSRCCQRLEKLCIHDAVCVCLDMHERRMSVHERCFQV
jgi:hypothetical protein